MSVTFPVTSHPTPARPVGSPGSPRRGHLRLTRRGRVVVVFGALGLLLAVGFTVGRVSASHAAGTDVPRSTVVQPGDTMWSIASKAAPNRDPRTVVADIQRLNHVTSAVLVPGMKLQLPS